MNVLPRSKRRHHLTYLEIRSGACQHTESLCSSPTCYRQTRSCFGAPAVRQTSSINLVEPLIRCARTSPRDTRSIPGVNVRVTTNPRSVLRGKRATGTDVAFHGLERTLLTNVRRY